jgi:glycine/D-amino acid oxidase-like deaminating enzyme
MMMETFRDKSFWLSTREYDPNPAFRGREEVDVAVVGGGFTGLSTAHFLKQEEPGLNIALLEGQVIGYGASGRNGGFSMTLFGMTLDLTTKRFSREKTKEAHHYMERAVDMVQDLIRKHRIDCDYEHPGFLRVATSEKYRERILHEIDLARSLGLEGIEWLGPAELSEQVKSPQYMGAWWEPRCGILNPAKLAWGWKEVIERQGVKVYEQTPAIEIRREAKGKIHIKVPWGEVVTRKLVLATNAYSHLIPQLRRKQAPVWTYIVLTEPLGEGHFREIGWQNRQGIEDARDLVHYYRLTADNRLLMGGRDVSMAFGNDMDLDRNEKVFIGLERDVRSIFPPLKDVSFTHRWGGPVSVPVDLAPALGYLGNKDTIYSLGCVGHGVSMTHLNGKTCADLALERRTDLTDVFFVNRTTIPFPPEPFRFLATRAITEFMRWEDRKYDVRG